MNHFLALLKVSAEIVFLYGAVITGIIFTIIIALPSLFFGVLPCIICTRCSDRGVSWGCHKG